MEQAVQVVGGKSGISRFCDPEEFRRIGRCALHVVLDAIKNAGFLLIDVRKEAGMLKVCLHIARWPTGKLARFRNNFFEHCRVKSATWRHPGNNPNAADGHVGILMR